MASDEVFDLVWRDFRLHLVEFSTGLLDNHSLADVKLICDGGEVVRAHKLILSACSPWFQKVILSLPIGPEAVIAIWDCPLSILTALLAFMYQGKVQVPQEDLPTFLKVAERLQVKGLIERVASQENTASEPENADANMDVEEEEDADYSFEEETKIEDEVEESDEDEDEVNEEEEMVNDLLTKSLGADAAKKEAERKVKETMLAAVEKKETLLETVVAPPSSADRKQAQRQVLKEMAEQKKFGLEREEKNEDEYQESKRKDIEALRDPSTDEKTRKAHIKALRIKAVEEAMKEKTKNSAKSKPLAEEEEDFEEEDDDLDPSSLVEAEMDENYEDTLVEVNIPGDDVLLPPNAEGKVFCTICKGGPMQKKHMTTHMKNKHGGQTFECVPCDKKFSCKAYLTSHQKSSCKERFRKLREMNAQRALLS